MKRKILLPIIFLIIGLFLTQSLISNFASAKGLDLSATREEIQKLEKENNGLELEIATYSSLSKIASAAAELKLLPTEMVYTSFDLPVAMGN